MKITRMTTILLRPAVLFTVVLLLLAAGGPAKAADVLGSFDSFTFGDCSADPSGKMFCSAVYTCFAAQSLVGADQHRSIRLEPFSSR